MDTIQPNTQPSTEPNAQPSAQPATPTGNPLTRPWQGTTLGVFSIIGLVSMGILILAIIVIIIAGESESSGGSSSFVVETLADSGMFLLVPLILFFILNVFVAKGIFAGRRWTITFTLIFSIAGALGYLDTLTVNLQAIIPLALNGFAVYLAAICQKHPFYNQATHG